MSWFALSLLSATAKAANQAVTKSLTRDFSILQIAAFGQLAAGILIMPLALFPGLVAVPVDPDFHQAALITISLNIVAILLLVESIRRSDLSYALPILGLTPVFAIFMAWLLRGEIINLQGIIGVLLVFAGTFSIDARSFLDWLLLGGRRIFRDTGVRLVVIVALLYSVTSVYDKTATLLSDPATFVWYSAVIRAIVLMLIYFAGRWYFRGGTAENSLKMANLLLFLLLGITFLIEAIAQMTAMQTGLVAFVIAIKRLSILMTSLAGMILYGERLSPARLSGALLIVIGAGVLYLY